MFVIVAMTSIPNYLKKTVGNLNLVSLDAFETELFRTYKDAKAVFDKLASDDIFQFKIAEMKPVVK